MRIAIDNWDPQYGVSQKPELTEAARAVDADVEIEAKNWKPILAQAGDAFDQVSFIDGVRRIEARVWITEDGADLPGVCASVAAGVVHCNSTSAEVVHASVQRALHTSAKLAKPIQLANFGEAGRYMVKEELTRPMKRSISLCKII